VGIKWAATACLACPNCLIGGETSCDFAAASGFITPGTFQQYVLSPAHYVTPIPDAITDLAGAAPLMCGGITVYTALKKAGVRFGDWVLVMGAGGGLGHLAIQYAKALGAQVVGLDAGTKEEFCKSLGADAFLDFTKFASDAELAAKVKEITGGGAKIVLACSSSSRAYGQAVSLLGFRGTLVCIGAPEGKDEPVGGYTLMGFISNELTITSVKSGNRLDAKECLEIAARGLVKTQYQLRKMNELTDVSVS
jgi:propanol-preferring alcohol dehydrogenase